MSGADWSDLLGGAGPPRRNGRRARVSGLRAWLPGLRAWLWGAAVALAVTGAAGALVAAYQAGRLLPLERIELAEAGQRVDSEAVREVLAPYLHPSLLGVDVRGAREALEGLPWVRRAEVRRAWPATLAVRLRERQALARWRDEGVMGASGEVFTPPPAEIPADLPRLRGPEGSAGKVAELFRSIRQLFDREDVKLAALRLSPRGSWRAELRRGAELAIGRQQPEERLERFIQALPALDAHGEGPLERVDLRYPNGLAVAWGGAEAKQ